MVNEIEFNANYSFTLWVFSTIVKKLINVKHMRVLYLVTKFPILAIMGVYILCVCVCVCVCVSVCVCVCGVGGGFFVSKFKSSKSCSPKIESSFSKKLPPE